MNDRLDAESMVDAMSFLHEEQQAMQELFQRFEALRGDDSKRYEKLFTAQEACNALNIYMHVNGELLYPCMRRYLNSADPIGAAYVEHMNTAEFAEEMDALMPDDENFDTRFSILANYADGHLRRELELLMPHLPRARIDLLSLGTSLRARKKELLQESVSVEGDD